MEYFKVQSEASAKMKAKYVYLRGLENLYVTRNSGQARTYFEEALKIREQNLKWVVKCLCM